MVTVEFKDILIETQLDEIVYLRRNGRKGAQKTKDQEVAHQEEIERLRNLLKENENRIRHLEDENQTLREENEDEVSENETSNSPCLVIFIFFFKFLI